MTEDRSRSTEEETEFHDAQQNIINSVDILEGFDHVSFHHDEDNAIDLDNIGSALANLMQPIPSVIETILENYGELTYGMETMLVGSAMGGRFGNTEELHVMSYEEAIAKDPVGWAKAVEEEHERMTTQHEVWIAKPPNEVEPNATIIDSTWAMKQKSDGKKRARLAGRGFRQVPFKDFDPSSIMAPVVSMMTIFSVLALIVICDWFAMLMDLKGAFLTAPFEPGRNIYMKIPKGFKKLLSRRMVVIAYEDYLQNQASFSSILGKALQSIERMRI